MNLAMMVETTVSLKNDGEYNFLVVGVRNNKSSDLDLLVEAVHSDEI